MGLTVAEKDHFRKRLAARCKELRTKIEQTQPEWKRDCMEQATKVIEDHFGVEPRLEFLAQLRHNRELLDAEIAEAEQKVVAQMSGIRWENVSTTERNRHYNYGNHTTEPQQYGRYPGEARVIVENHVEHQADILAEEHPVGKQIHQVTLLEAEILDDLQACGTHTQLQRVWNNAREKLGIVETDAGERQPRGIKVREKGEE